MDIILKQTTINLIDFRYQAKSAHWNCKGFLFYELHLLFDRIYDEYERLIDRLAERCVGLGGQIPGISQIATLSELPPQPLDIESGLDFARDLLAKLGTLKALNLININLCNESNDQTSLNVLCEVQEKIDSHIYLLNSTLR